MKQGKYDIDVSHNAETGHLVIVASQNGKLFISVTIEKSVISYIATELGLKTKQ